VATPLYNHLVAIPQRETVVQEFKISTDNNDLDLEVIYEFISHSYWAADIPKATLEKAISNSFCFGVYDASGHQVGFARLITDKATFAYLADVFIIESQRGRGLSKWLVETIVTHPELQGLRRMILATRDAHGLYAQYGFKPVENPEVLMQIWQPNIYCGTKA
jgi:N-acetylglutamate synthase-like GNAT family acetyltransferase